MVIRHIHVLSYPRFDVLSKPQWRTGQGPVIRSLAVVGGIARRTLRRSERAFETFGAGGQHAVRMEHGVYASHSIQRGRLGPGFGPIYGGAHMSAAALNKHYRVRELAALWGFSDNTIIRIFSSEPGVIRLESGVGRRKYTTLSVPESVVLRVHERLGQEPLQTQFSAGNPLR